MSDITVATDLENDNCPFKLQTPFPDVTEGKIKTEEFLAASRDVVKLIDKFGKLFAPVKYDMQGNIEKLTAKYNKDPQNHSTLQEMILREKAAGETIIAIDALQWLRRGLHMILLFFEEIVEDFKAGKATEDLVAFLKKAYKETLEPYHGWMAQQLFGLLSRMVPARTQLLQSLSDGQKCEDGTVLRYMDIYLKNLRINIETLRKFYLEEGLENTDRV